MAEVLSTSISLDSFSRRISLALSILSSRTATNLVQATTKKSISCKKIRGLQKEPRWALNFQKIVSDTCILRNRNIEQTTWDATPRYRQFARVYHRLYQQRFREDDRSQLNEISMICEYLSSLGAIESSINMYGAS